MIPTTRLIFWTAVIVLPFAAVAPAVPSALWLAVAIITAFIALAATDAVRARRMLTSVSVELPALVRLQKDHPGSFEVAIDHPSHPRFVRVGLPLPDAFTEAAHERTIHLAPDAAHSRFTWECTASTRGRYTLDRAYLEVLSPIGFWAVRGRRAVRSELRVYPNLFQERRQVAAIFLRRAQAGVHTQRQAGQGREFEKLRNYLRGDPLSDIHWKASAKRGELVTRLHQVERTHEVYVAIDASRLSGRPVAAHDAAGRPAAVALERYVAATLVLALAAEQQGDQFGLITFSDRVLSCVRASSGSAHFDACRDALYTLQPRKVSPDFDELFTFIRLRLRKRALLIVLTALDDPVLAESFISASEMVARQHLVVVDLLQPAEVRPLLSEEQPPDSSDDLYRSLAGHLRWHKLRELQKILQRRGVRLSLLDPAQLSAQMIAQHSEIRARQLV